MSYLIHFNGRHDPKTGKFTWGDGDGDGKKNDRKTEKISKTQYYTKIDKVGNYKKVSMPTERADKSSGYKKVQTGPERSRSDTWRRDKPDMRKKNPADYNPWGSKPENGNWDHSVKQPEIPKSKPEDHFIKDPNHGKTGEDVYSGGGAIGAVKDFIEDVTELTADELDELLKKGYKTSRQRKSKSSGVINRTNPNIAGSRKEWKGNKSF